ncbi:MAG TPA: sugar ABC transporter permease [Verrucomicrobiales bacterium]|nr:sugar ABC transporter permease [Verrucomicrobiales bacterium]
MQTKKIFGILSLLVAVVLFTASQSGSFLDPFNLENLIRRTSLFGIISIGVAFVIITGGIDLSIGSVICLVGCGLPWLVMVQKWPLAAAVPAVFSVAVLIGVAHGFLITRLKIQPFVVTLCGLLLYRGLARGFTQDQTMGFQSEYKGFRALATAEIPITDQFGIPMPFVLLVVLAVLAAVFLNRTIYGRYLLAIGRNEEAARFSGINTRAMILVAYVISATMAGIGGILFMMDSNFAQPSEFGNFYELYAIAAAVLGGCSLRGGEGSILGVLIGTALMQVLQNMINLVDWIPTNIEFAVIGAVILCGVVADEVVKRMAALRRAAQARTGA